MSPLTGASLVFDVVLAVLLAATIVYAVMLNRKLTALRSAKLEMEALFARLVTSTQKAESGIESLKGQVRDSGAHLTQLSVDVATSRATATRRISNEVRLSAEVGEGSRTP